MRVIAPVFNGDDRLGGEEFVFAMPGATPEVARSRAEELLKMPLMYGQDGSGEALAVTLAAQAGAMPLLLATFGSVPLATVPANLLAVPAAGPLMVSGVRASSSMFESPSWMTA